MVTAVTHSSDKCDSPLSHSGGWQYWYSDRHVHFSHWSMTHLWLTMLGVSEVCHWIGKCFIARNLLILQGLDAVAKAFHFLMDWCGVMVDSVLSVKTNCVEKHQGSIHTLVWGHLLFVIIFTRAFNIPCLLPHLLLCPRAFFEKCDKTMIFSARGHLRSLYFEEFCDPFQLNIHCVLLWKKWKCGWSFLVVSQFLDKIWKQILLKWWVRVFSFWGW